MPIFEADRLTGPRNPRSPPTQPHPAKRKREVICVRTYSRAHASRRARTPSLDASNTSQALGEIFAKRARGWIRCGVCDQGPMFIVRVDLRVGRRGFE